MGVITLIGIAILNLFTTLISSSCKLIERRIKAAGKITKTGWTIVILKVIVNVFTL